MNNETSVAEAVDTDSVDELHADDVAAYLRAHPEFFLQQDDLLAELSLPHASGNAISLLERQVTIFREREIEARQKLNNLLKNARNNDQLFDTTRNLVLALLRAKNVTEITNVAVDQLSSHDSIDACEIILIEHTDLQVANSVRTDSLASLKHRFGDVLRLKRTHCGALKGEHVDWLFNNTESVKSTALCPVISNGKVLALLALGNYAENYFNVNLDTLFLDFIGHVVGAVLERQLFADTQP